MVGRCTVSSSVPALLDATARTVFPFLLGRPEVVNCYEGILHNSYDRWRTKVDGVFN